VFIIHLLEELAFKLTADVLRMHEIAITSSIACSFVVLTAFGFPEISHGRIFRDDDFACIVPAVESTHSGLCLIFSDILNVNIADHMFSNIVSDDNFFKLAEFSKLHENLLIKVLKMIDCLD
jgi:hypothetical protein